MIAACNDNKKISAQRVGPTEIQSTALKAKLGKGIMYFLERENHNQKGRGNRPTRD
jgi:hypothetical protein